MSVRMRHTREHTANRRSHHALKEPRLSTCGSCGASHMRHTMCAKCGNYRGREVVDVVSQVAKKQDKRKARLESLHGPAESDEKAPQQKDSKLDAEELSKK